jgi:hypothetical protein
MPQVKLAKRSVFMMAKSPKDRGDKNSVKHLDNARAGVASAQDMTGIIPAAGDAVRRVSSQTKRKERT